MFKKIILLVCIVVGASLFYCSKLNNGAQNNVVIQFSSWGSESEISILKPILLDFEKENPEIKIDFLHIPQNYFQKLHLLFASNTAPDVVFMNNQYLPIYANAGVLEDLSKYDNELKFEDFYQKTIDTLTWNGHIYAIPRDVSNLVFYYNKNLFDKNNIDYPKDDWTYTDFISISKKLTKSPEVFGVSFEEEPLFYMPYLMSFGVNNIPKYEDKNVQMALNKYADLRFKYKVAPLKQNVASATMAQMFLQGRLGLYLSGRWLVPKFREEANFDWDIVQFPICNNGSIVPMDTSGWAISKSSKHKAEALKLIKYLSSKNSSQKFTQSGLIVPARIDVANSKYFLDEKKPNNAKIFIDIIKSSKPTPVNIHYKETLDDLKLKSEYLLNKK